MTNTAIQDYWSRRGEQIVTYSMAILHPLKLQDNTTNFLHLIGLPVEAAPFLSFSENTSGQWNSISRLTDIDSTFDSSFAHLIQIGSDGSGNPIIVETADNDSIKLLDHDNSFSLQSINSSIESFASSLVAYTAFIDAVMAQNEDNAYFDTHFTNEQFESLEKALKSADNQFDESVFWKNELSILLGNREQFRNESGD